jgi:hypothetical protein
MTQATVMGMKRLKRNRPGLFISPFFPESFEWMFAERKGGKIPSGNVISGKSFLGLAQNVFS